MGDVNDMVSSWDDLDVIRGAFMRMENEREKLEMEKQELLEQVGQLTHQNAQLNVSIADAQWLKRRVFLLEETLNKLRIDHQVTLNETQSLKDLSEPNSRAKESAGSGSDESVYNKLPSFSPTIAPTYSRPVVVNPLLAMTMPPFPFMDPSPPVLPPPLPHLPFSKPATARSTPSPYASVTLENDKHNINLALHNLQREVAEIRHNILHPPPTTASTSRPTSPTISRTTPVGGSGYGGVPGSPYHYHNSSTVTHIPSGSPKAKNNTLRSSPPPPPHQSTTHTQTHNTINTRTGGVSPFTRARSTSPAAETNGNNSEHSGLYLVNPTDTLPLNKPHDDPGTPTFTTPTMTAVRTASQASPLTAPVAAFITSSNHTGPPPTTTTATSTTTTSTTSTSPTPLSCAQPSPPTATALSGIPIGPAPSERAHMASYYNPHTYIPASKYPILPPAHIPPLPPPVSSTLRDSSSSPPPPPPGVGFSSAAAHVGRSSPSPTPPLPPPGVLMDHMLPHPYINMNIPPPILPRPGSPPRCNSPPRTHMLPPPPHIANYRSGAHVGGSLTPPPPIVPPPPILPSHSPGPTHTTGGVGITRSSSPPINNTTTTTQHFTSDVHRHHHLNVSSAMSPPPRALTPPPPTTTTPNIGALPSSTSLPYPSLYLDSSLQEDANRLRSLSQHLETQQQKHAHKLAELTEKERNINIGVGRQTEYTNKPLDDNSDDLNITSKSNPYDFISQRYPSPLFSPTPVTRTTDILREARSKQLESNATNLLNDMERKVWKIETKNEEIKSIKTRLKLCDTDRNLAKQMSTLPSAPPLYARALPEEDQDLRRQLEKEEMIAHLNDEIKLLKGQLQQEKQSRSQLQSFAEEIKQKVLPSAYVR